MKKYRNIMTVLVWKLLFGITACSNYSGDRPPADKNIAGSSYTEKQQPNTATTGSLNIQKNKLAVVYTQAISAFLKAAYKRGGITYDTLYFGKHVYGQPDDFPDIELPQTIEKTQIRLVTPEEGQIKLTERKSTVYINMAGWVDKEKAEFVLVVFSNGAEHQYDYFINFTANNSTNKFELEKIEFENYLQLNGQKPERITIYKNGKYVAVRLRCAADETLLDV